MLTELYKSGKLKQDALGVLAKTVICIKTGCIASGPEAYLGNTTIQLAETIAISPKVQKPPQPKQPQTKTRQEVKPAPQPPQRPPPPPPTPSTQQEPSQTQHSWDTIVSLLTREAKIDKQKAELVLNAISSYLSVYPSVGVLRLIEDISRKTKVEARAVKSAVEILKTLDYLEVKEEGVVNLKKAMRSGEILL